MKTLGHIFQACQSVYRHCQYQQKHNSDLHENKYNQQGLHINGD